jgi:hypothetical protein
LRGFAARCEDDVGDGTTLASVAARGLVAKASRALSQAPSPAVRWALPARFAHARGKTEARHRLASLPSLELPLLGSNQDSPDPESGDWTYPDMSAD